MARFLRPVIVAGTLAATSLLGSSAMAQRRVISQGGAQGGQPTVPPSRYLLDYFELMQEHVQKQLKLSNEQKETLVKIRQEQAELSRKDIAGLWNLSPEERRTKLAEFRERTRQRRDDLWKAVEEVLTADQLEALKA